MISNLLKIMNKLTGKEAVDSLIVANISSKNLFNKNNIVENYYLSYTDGTPTWDSNMAYMYDYIKVEPNTKYTISYPTSTIFIIHEYDENKNFIKYQNQNDSNTSFTITTSSSTKFVRLSCGKNYIDKMQFEKYPIATNFSEHIDFEGNTKKIITTGVEFKTGRIIDGNEEYGKRIYFGTLPNNSSKSVSHNITNANKITGYQTFANNVNGSFGGITLPRAIENNYIELQITETDIFIASNYDASNFSAEVDIYYTKN